MNKIYNRALFLLVAIAAISLQACKKTEYDYQKSPYNEIVQFSILGSTGDSTKCFISGDSISVYWNPAVPQPANVTPTILIDNKATISPASGVSVPFTKGTAYKVTAENGEVKTYYLNPKLNIPIASISSVSGPVTWLSQTEMQIFGENFLAGTDPSKLQVYMQRLSDGVEIPLELDANRITNYSVIGKLPEFSAEQDTGLHRIYVKTGSQTAQNATVRFITPYISNTSYTSTFEQEGQTLHTGDKVTINYAITDNYGGKVASYYHARNIDYVMFYAAPTYQQVIIRDGITKGDSKVEFNLPNMDAYAGQTLVQYRFVYKSVPADQAVYSYYYLRGYINQTTPVALKQ